MVLSNAVCSSKKLQEKEEDEKIITEGDGDYYRSQERFKLRTIGYILYERGRKEAAVMKEETADGESPLRRTEDTENK